MPTNTSTITGVEAKPARPVSSLRRTVFLLLEPAKDKDTCGRVLDIALIFLIATSVLAVVLESLPAVERAYGPALYWLEVFTIAVFSVEYVLRVWTCVEANAEFRNRPFGHRVRFIFSFHLTIDLLAILPFYLLTFGILGGVDMRFLRSIRLLRVLKLTRYFAALNMLIMAVKENSRALGASLLILMTVMLLAASGMYYFERQSQPVDFGSIPAAMWWAFATLTTVGYGDVYPFTVGGKIFGALISVVGIGMVALPTSILASGYSHQLKLSRDTYRDKSDEALDDGVLSADELRDLETLRLDLGLGKHTASQILDKGAVRAALQDDQDSQRCPHCQQALP